MSFEHEGFRIYVASLSDYNAGILHGVWLDFDNFDHITDLWKVIKEMLAASPDAKDTGRPAEEWAIHDYEGWLGFSLSEYEDLDTLWDAYTILSEVLEEYDAEAVYAYVKFYEGTLDEVDDCSGAALKMPMSVTMAAGKSSLWSWPMIPGFCPVCRKTSSTTSTIPPSLVTCS